VVAKQDGRFLAVVCCLDGDDAADANMRIVARALRAEQTLQVVLDWRRIAVGDAADQTAAELRARQRADEIGRQYRADLVVWGEVAKSGEGLRLHFQAVGQILTRDLTVSKGFLDAAYKEPLNSLLGLVAATAALSEVASLTDTGRFVADRLEPLADRLKRALEDRALDLDPGQRAGLWHSLGVALAQIGEQRGDDDALREAVAAYRAALEEYTRERVPLDWAMTQNNLGNALAILGARRGRDAALREAVDAYRAALEVYTRERAPMQWAMTQNNLGNALAILGMRSADAALCEAVAAYRAALQELTRERVPLDWAATQTNLGNALAILGERRGDDAALRAAVDAYRAALEVYTRERAPMQWAMTQANLALALRAQAERGRDAALIVKALAAIDGAIEEFAMRAAPHGLAKAQQDRDRIIATARALGLT
jgi:tetratricopeptide (TPR) repeat protein